MEREVMQRNRGRLIRKKEDNVMYLSEKEITNNKSKTRQKYCQALSAITPYLCGLIIHIAPEEAIDKCFTMYNICHAHQFLV